MKKQILVMATITIEGENLNHTFISSILSRIKKYFLYKFNYEKKDFTIIKVEISDNFVELNK
jgi:hypothetical protein